MSHIVEAINLVGGLLRTFEFGSSILQMFKSYNACTYARRFPWREIDSWEALSPPTASRSGVPPATEIRHKPKSPPRTDGNTISRPSWVHANPLIQRLSKVRRLGSPPPTGTM